MKAAAPEAAAAVPHRDLPHALVVALLALLLGLQPITTDLYLPALPALRADLGAAMSATQLTLSALIIVFGLAQLAWGPLADRYGRRACLIVGLSLYVAAAVASAWAPGIDALVVARALQGVGLAAAVVCARAMLRDLFEPHEGTRVMSQALSGLGVIALAAPIVGGLLASHWGWRAALLSTGVFAAVSLALLMLRMPETIRERNVHALAPGPLLARYGRIGTHPTFLAWALLTAGTYAGLYAFLAGSSFTFATSFGIRGSAFGPLLATSSLAYLFGTAACRRWLLRHGIRGAVMRGGLCTAAGSLALVLPAAFDLHGPVSLLAAQWLYSFGHGIHQPCGQAGMVGPFPREAGAAAALGGFVLSAAAFGMGLLLGVVVDGRVAPLACTVAACGAVTALLAFTLVQRHGDPASAAAR